MTTQRRPRIWVDTRVDVNLAAAGVDLTDLLVNAVVDVQSRTIIRWIGRIICVPSVVANATVSLQRCSVGVGVVSRDAFAAAGAAVPSPAIMTEFPTQGWVYRDIAVLVNQQDSGTVEAWHFPEFRFDIRASRKVDRGVAFLKLENADFLAGTTSIKFAGILRCLTLT